jgi:hypothetical protein
MIDTRPKLRAITRRYIDRGEYFVINRPRQYGKTTTLFLLAEALSDEYLVLRKSFEGRDSFFDSMERFANAIRYEFEESLNKIDPALAEIWREPFAEGGDPQLYLRNNISALCAASGKPIILMIDEVDKATNFQVFNAFLGMLRDLYIQRDTSGEPTFKSVILAGVTDIKNMKRKIRPDEKHGVNSPWNIAADFTVDMSFSAAEIAGMLEDYETDHNTGMNIKAVSEQLYYYTSGYPFLVSRLCKIIDEDTMDWTAEGVDDAETQILSERNTLFDDMSKNILNVDSLKALLEGILFRGTEIGYDPDNPMIHFASMYGIIKSERGKIRIANIIFETRITNMLLSMSETQELGSRYASEPRYFFRDGKLDMDGVCERFAYFMAQEYRDSDAKFIEGNARLLFLAFLRPIINGTGHYAVEPQTRGDRRMDIRVFYGREEHVIELKIWRGEKYEQEGIAQLAEYLSILGQPKGWLLSFCDLTKTPRDGGVYEVDGRTISETIIAFRDKA